MTWFLAFASVCIVLGALGQRLAWSFAICAIAIAMCGCASLDREPPPIRGTGESASPPMGWINYCLRHPDDVACLEWTK